MDNVNKTAMLTVKLTPQKLEEFKIAAELRGTTMSSLVSQFVTVVIREEKAAAPEAFGKERRVI